MNVRANIRKVTFRALVALTLLGKPIRVTKDEQEKIRGVYREVLPNAPRASSSY